MPRRLAQQRMILNELEWPFHTLRAVAAVAELLVYTARQPIGEAEYCFYRCLCVRIMCVCTITEIDV